MARRGRPPKGTSARPGGGDVVGEAGLAVAVLQRVVSDLQSDHPEHKAAAVEFLNHPQALTFWTSLIGVDAEAFLARVRPHLP